MQGKVYTKIDNKIATVTFHHPKSNSLPEKLLNELAEQISTAGNNDEVKVIVLKSEGEKTFCAGASFDELEAITDFETGKKFFMGFANVINAMRKCEKLIIVRVQGKTVGGGVGIVAAADYAFATKEAFVKLSELALGLGPFVVGLVVERKIGKSAASEMTIDYEWKSPEWASQKGLFNDVAISIEELDKKVNALVNKLADGSIDAMKELKKALWEGTENWDKVLEQKAEISSRLALSDFTKSYIKEFKKKKK